MQILIFICDFFVAVDSVVLNTVYIYTNIDYIHYRVWDTTKLWFFFLYNAPFVVGSLAGSMLTEWVIWFGGNYLQKSKILIQHRANIY